MIINNINTNQTDKLFETTTECFLMDCLQPKPPHILRDLTMLIIQQTTHAMQRNNSVKVYLPQDDKPEIAAL